MHRAVVERIAHAVAVGIEPQAEQDPAVVVAAHARRAVQRAVGSNRETAPGAGPVRAPEFVQQADRAVSADGEDGAATVGRAAEGIDAIQPATGALDERPIGITAKRRDAAFLERAEHNDSRRRRTDVELVDRPAAKAAENPASRRGADEHVRCHLHQRRVDAPADEGSGQVEGVQHLEAASRRTHAERSPAAEWTTAARRSVKPPVGAACQAGGWPKSIGRGLELVEDDEVAAVQLQPEDGTSVIGASRGERAVQQAADLEQTSERCIRAGGVVEGPQRRVVGSVRVDPENRSTELRRASRAAGRGTSNPRRPVEAAIAGDHHGSFRVGAVDSGIEGMQHPGRGRCRVPAEDRSAAPRASSGRRAEQGAVRLYHSLGWNAGAGRTEGLDRRRRAGRWIEPVDRAIERGPVVRRCAEEQATDLDQGGDRTASGDRRHEAVPRRDGQRHGGEIDFVHGAMPVGTTPFRSTVQPAVGRLHQAGHRESWPVRRTVEGGVLEHLRRRVEPEDRSVTAAALLRGPVQVGPDGDGAGIGVELQVGDFLEQQPGGVEPEQRPPVLLAAALRHAVEQPLHHGQGADGKSALGVRRSE